jgi:hypothetical protein
MHVLGERGRTSRRASRWRSASRRVRIAGAEREGDADRRYAIVISAQRALLYCDRRRLAMAAAPIAWTPGHAAPRRSASSVQCTLDVATVLEAHGPGAQGQASPTDGPRTTASTACRTGLSRHHGFPDITAAATGLYPVSVAVPSVMVYRDAGCLATRRDQSPASRCVVPAGERPAPVTAGAAGRSASGRAGERSGREGLLTPVLRREEVSASHGAA